MREEKVVQPCQLQHPCWQSTAALKLNPESNSVLRLIRMSHRMLKRPLSGQKGGTSETKAINWSSVSLVKCDGSAWLL